MQCVNNIIDNNINENWHCRNMHDYLFLTDLVDSDKINDISPMVTKEIKKILQDNDITHDNAKKVSNSVVSFLDIITDFVAVYEIYHRYRKINPLEKSPEIVEQISEKKPIRQSLVVFNTEEIKDEDLEK